MNKKRLTEEVKAFAVNEGADLVGIANVERWKNAPKKLCPQAHLPEAKSVISIAVHHPDASVEWAGEPNSNYAGPFQIGMIPKLDTISFRIARFLEEQGFAVIPFSCTFYWRHRPYKDVPYAHAASFSHMNAFAAAGLGEYGWHGMVMSPEYGPRQRLVSVITSAELAPDSLYKGEKLCDRCGLCEKYCWGNNYKEERLLSPKYIQFKIEDKLFKYPNINRWRCFWGEQCHLDMNELSMEKDLTEEKIYQAIKRGVKRKIYGAAGYCCSSLKFCMAKPVRKWDRAYTPGPRRKKDKKMVPLPDILKKIEELAINTGADRIAVQPLDYFKNLKNNFYNGFRTDAFFNNYSRIITLGRSIGNWENLGSLAKRNKPALEHVTVGGLMMGIMDISRYLDNLGIDAVQDWQLTGITGKAVELAGWDNKTICAQSVICRLNLEKTNKLLKASAAPAQLKINKSMPFLKNIDKIGVVSIDKIQHSELREIKKSNPDLRTLIVLLSGMPRRVVELAGKQEAECGMSYAFVNFQIIRETLWAARDLADYLQRQGRRAIPLIDLTENSYQTLGTGVGQYLPDLRANAPFAAAAGFGEIGLNGMLLTPEFGPRQRYSFVLTNAELAESLPYKGPKLCRENCTLCADACPVQALYKNKKTKLFINKKQEYPVFERQETRCRWARNLGMVAGEGSSLLGWQIPDLPVPDSLSDDEVKKALAMKDTIQSICYKNPNHSDIIIEKCLQACPVGVKENVGKEKARRRQALSLPF